MSELIPGLSGTLVLGADAYSSTDRRKWLEARRSGLGASETAAVLGVNKWATPLDIWREKLNTAPAVDNSVGDAADWGQRLEDPIARAVSKRDLAPLGLKVYPTPGLLAHPEHRWMLATLDRLVVPRGGPHTLKAVTLLEIKTTNYRNYLAYWLDGIPPAYIQVQVQQQLAVTGLPYAYVSCLVDGRDLKPLVKIERDERVIEQLIEYGGQWWHSYVEGQTMPEPLFADLKTLATVWPGGDANPVLLTDELEAHLGAYAFHGEKEKEHKALKDKAGLEVKKVLKDRETIVDDEDRVRATWKPSIVRRLDSTRLRKELPDVAKEYTNETNERRFTVKDLGA